MELINVTDPATLKELYNCSALTFEGVIVEEADQYRDFFKDCTEIDESKPCYVISGKMMNDTYGLMGSHAYPDDLHIICFKHDTFKDVSKIIIKRFQIGGRWFDDVVDNNARRI